jgi:tRNA threonylcarbamoyl adenosine modification protein YjeE
VIILLQGEMGAGKTYFVQKFVSGATSPTFTIINQYADNIFHADLYRIKSQSELVNTDFFEILKKCDDDKSLFFIEWPYNNVDKNIYKSLKNVIRINIDQNHKIVIS